MDVIDIETLLAPVSAEAPCGSNLEYQPPLTTLQALARGTPARYVGDRTIPAEEPDWSEVREQSEALFSVTKDLRVAGILHRALLKTSGIAGLEAGLCLQRRLLEQYWDHLNPPLDVEEDNDPLERINSLRESLISEDALTELRALPLVESRQFGKHSLRNYRIAKGVVKAPGTDGEPIDAQQELARMEAAFADVSVEGLSHIASVIRAAAEHMAAIEQVLIDKAGGVPADITVLGADLREMKGLLDAQVGKRVTTSPVSADDLLEVMSPRTDAAGTAVAPTGAIRNRSDVLLMIDKICEYYARAEPTSPVPFLLQRAKRLVNMDFMEILRDMTPSGVSEAEIIVGLEKSNS